MTTTSARSWLVPCVVLALVIVVAVIRAAWADVAFFTAALALAIAQTRAERPPRHALRGRPPRPWIGGAALTAGVILAWAPRHGLASGAVVGLLGLVTVTVAALGGWRANGGRTPPHPGGPASRRAVLAWGAIIVAAGLWELTAYLTWRWGVLPDGVMPSISDVLDPLLEEPVGKVAFVLVWLTGGTALLLRAWRGPDRCD